MLENNLAQLQIYFFLAERRSHYRYPPQDLEFYRRFSRSGPASHLDFCEFHKKDLSETPPRDQTSSPDEADFWKCFHNIGSQRFRDSHKN